MRPLAKGPTPDQVTAVTWNVFNGTATSVLSPIVARLAGTADVLLLQEAAGIDITEMVSAAGFRITVASGSNRVAWRPDRLTSLASTTVQLAATAWHTKGGKPMTVTMPVVILGDTKGRTVTVGSYHLPPHVQAGGNVTSSVPARVKSTEESMATLRNLTRAALTHGVLFGGDDNFDERLGRWPVLRRAYTGLRVVQAPGPTHGTRRIDDFRVKGLRPRAGATFPGGGDHLIHLRTFDWR